MGTRRLVRAHPAVKTIRGHSVKAVAEKTYNKCGELLFVCRGEVHHGVEDLDTGIGVDIDAVLIWCAEMEG